MTVNAQMILKNDLGDTLEAILAHEVGHHVRFPATMQTHARLRLLERTLVPFDDYSLINLFTDLMINERLGDRLREPLIESLPRLHRGAGVPRRGTVEARSGIPLLPGSLRRALGPGARWLDGPGRDGVRRDFSRLPGRGPRAGGEPLRSGAEPLHAVPLLSIRHGPLPHAAGRGPAAGEPPAPMRSG